MHPILNVVVVSFHHKRGCEVEYSHPKLDGSGENGLPVEWVQLPNLALPDGIHNVDQDTIYFLLPSRTEPGKCVFGISCYRQIASKDLLERPDDVTRTSVQKSVCVITRIPLFGALKAKLEVITQAYFEQRDFGKVDVLGQMYSNLCDIFDESISGEFYASLPSHEISVQDLFVKYRHRALTLFKLILLERKVLFYASSGRRLGESMLGFISLFPSLLEDGLYYATSANFTETKPSTSQEERKTDEVVIEEDVGVTLCKRDPLKKNSFGFPLSLFTQGSYFDPYVSVHYMDTALKATSCVLGATNALFATRQELFDVVVRIDEVEGQPKFTIEWRNGVEKLVSLTQPDLRFADFILKKVEEQLRSSTAEFDGSDEWIRLQMRNYLLALGATAKKDVTSSVQQYGTPFVNSWRATKNFKIWMAGKHEDFDAVAPGHLCAEQMGVYDMYLRLEHVVGGSEGASKVIGAVNSTGKNLGTSIGETGSRVKAKFSSWWNRKTAEVVEQGEEVKESR